MIIQCPNCLTKFKLDDSKIKDEGTKVRCTKCKEVFLATKEAPTPPPPPSASLQPPQEKEEFEFSFGEEGKEEEPLGFGVFPEEPKKEEAEEKGFSFGGFEEKEGGPELGGMSYGEVSIPPEETKPKEEGFEFKEDTPFGGFEFKEEPFHEEAFAAAKEEPAPSPTLVSPPIIEERVEAKEEVPEKREFAEGKGETGFEEALFPEFEETKKEKKPYLKIAVILVAIIAIVASLYVWKGYKGAETGEITLSELSGYYTQNAEAGDIFVISGRATNNTNRARSFFQVRGVLFNAKGEKMAQKEVYCGNIFSPKEIETLPREKIEADLKNKVGSSLSNINLAPGKSVPFMIVFFDLPKEMAEFSVEVTGSQVASE